MEKSKLTVDEVMEKIRKAMQAKQSMDQLQDNDTGVNKNGTERENELNHLDQEIHQNNMKWNVNAEHPITSHRRRIGWFIVFGKKVLRKILRWYVMPPIDQQREFNGSTTRSLNVLADFAHNQSQSLKDAQARIEHLEGLLSAISIQFQELSSAGSGIEPIVEPIVDSLSKKADRQEVEANREMLAVKADKEELETSIEETETHLDKIEKALSLKADHQEIHQLESELTIIADRLRRLERKINKGLHLESGIKTVEHLVQEDREENFDIDYFLFEQRFRGSREDIKKRQRVYLDYFRDKNNVLDIGCGRGEFIELLIENGINVQGIDINEDMVGYCQDRGLPVIQVDLFTHLEGLDDNSLDGIFAAQVIEHMKPVKLAKFIELCKKKLKATGVVVVETINPKNLTAVSNWFYMDPTHIRPVHPETLKFLMESIGFKDVHLKYMNPSNNELLPQLNIESIEGNIKAFNDGIGQLNELLNGHQDYALICFK